MSLLSLETVQYKQETLKRTMGLAVKLGSPLVDAAESAKKTYHQRAQIMAARDAASVLVNGIVRELREGKKVATVHIARQPRHGFPGTFLKLAGAETDLLLLSNKIDVVGFDLPTSRRVSRIEVPASGIGNGRVMDWRRDRLSFVFSPDYAAAEVHSLGALAVAPPAPPRLELVTEEYQAAA